MRCSAGLIVRSTRRGSFHARGRSSPRNSSQRRASAILMMKKRPSRRKTAPKHRRGTPARAGVRRIWKKRGEAFARRTTSPMRRCVHTRVSRWISRSQLSVPRAILPLIVRKASSGVISSLISVRRCPSARRSSISLVPEGSRGSHHKNEGRPPDDNTHRKPTERNQKPATISPNAHPVFLPANAWGDTSFINPLWKQRSPYSQVIATRRTQRPTVNAQTKRAQLYPKIA